MLLFYVRKQKKVLQAIVITVSNTKEIVELKWKDFEITHSIQANQYKVTTFVLNDCTKNYTIGKHVQNKMFFLKCFNFVAFL